MSNELSIVIATYNDDVNLAATLQSVREQTAIDWRDVQVIVSDGGSTDRTQEVVRSFSDVIDIVDSRQDAGVYDGMNIGASLATGGWLHFLNAGDTFHSANSISEWKTAVDSSENNAAWIVSGAINLRSRTARPVRIPNLPHSWWRHAYGLQPHCHQATWFRRSIFETVGGYRLDAGFAADFDLILRFGVISPPLEVTTTLIDYLGGGLSEVRGAQIPELLHRIRVERLNFGHRAAAVDLGASKVIGRYNRMRRRVGAIRLYLKGRSTADGNQRLS